MTTLTDVAARQAEADTKPYKISAGKGLFLLVHPNGGKYRRFKYRFSGREKLLALGVYPDVSLAEPGTRHNAAPALLTAGKDPSETRRVEKRQQRVAADNSFEGIAREWVKIRSAKWTEEHATATLDSLKANIFPSLGARPIADIKTSEILEVLKRHQQQRQHHPIYRKRCRR